MIPLITTLFGVFGLIIGSFLNVVILRFNTKRSLGGRSACMSCASSLSWYELIPVISYVALRGRCRNCKTGISKIYPIVELSTALLFVGLFLKFQDVLFSNMPAFIFTYAYYALMFSLLIVVAFYDLRHKIIPDSLAIILGVLSFFGLFFFDQFGFNIHTPTKIEFLSGIMIAVPFAFFWLISKGEWMGLGDAKLALSLGWLLGISRALSAVVASFWLGAGFGIILLFFSRVHGMKSEIPFAPFLVLGTILAFLFELHIFSVF